MPKWKYEVVVGNIGTTVATDSKQEAMQDYTTYMHLSLEDCGRAAGEDVTLFEDGEPIKEYIGTLTTNEMQDAEN